jgi:hypothetical protein
VNAVDPGGQARRVVRGVRRRLGRYRQRFRDSLPRRLDAWQEPSTATAAGLDEIVAPTTGALRRHIPDGKTARLKVVVEDWRTPYPGWSGRLGPLPHLLRTAVTLPESGRGRAEVTVELGEPAHTVTIVAAVLRVLHPTRDLPAPARADLALDGPLPGWLPPHAVAQTPAGPDPDDAPVRPYDVRLTDQPHTGRAAALDPADVGPIVDATAANPLNRRRYDGRLATGRLTVADGRWQITKDGTTVVAGRVGEPLDVRQTDVLADLAAVDARDDAASADRAATSAASAASPGRGAAAHNAAADHAATLVQLAMTGVLVHAPDVPRDLIAPELADLITAPLPAAEADPLDRELASVRQRRAAMKNHATAFALPTRTDDRYPTLTTPPTVTVLLMTRRPERLPAVLADLAAQTYPQIEVVVGLHGVDLTDEAKQAVAGHPQPVHTVTVQTGRGFGEALGEATRRASGSLLTKVDDDDRYGPEHVWDLVLARHYSGAEVVGKGAEFVYLEPRDKTVRRRMANEIYTDVVAGGTVLLAKGDLEAIGGWRPVERSVDRALLDRVLADGGLIYRTHGFGFIYVRHGDGHTWDPGLDYFAKEPVRRWDGLPPYEEFGPRR